MMTDSSGNVIGQEAHYPFGEQWYAQNTATKWLLTSYERDSESGNDYASFRYNVNRLGRFASPGPLAGNATSRRTSPGRGPSPAEGRLSGRLLREATARRRADNSGPLL
jgi:hypothetical protein